MSPDLRTGTETQKDLHFLHVNAERIGPDGYPYAVDTSALQNGGPVVLPGGPKVVKIEVANVNVRRVYVLTNVPRTDSNPNDIRINFVAGLANITDSGSLGKSFCPII